MSHFRPIALCNVVYKVVTKIITQRLRNIMPYLVSCSQSSFVPGRSITDNILVLQETVHSLSNLHGKKGFMILRLDLEKAYDRLEWSFIRETLEIIGMPSLLINVISKCLDSVSMCINWNGERTISFNTSRGLRQGDPISPYIFVLALERLGQRIQDLVEDGSWKPLKFGRGNAPKVSHINFVDDLVLITEASMDQTKLIQDLLNEFCLTPNRS